MTATSNTKAKKALPETRLPHHKTIITSEIAADASASCGHHPWWVRYPQETATKLISGKPEQPKGAYDRLPYPEHP